MPIGLVSEFDFKKEVNSYEKNEASLIRTEISLGRNNANAVPEELREVIAEEKLQGAKTEKLSEIFKVSTASVSAYANGATSTASYNKPNNKLKQVKERVAKKAGNRLIALLNEIEGRNLEEVKFTDLSSVAKDMASITEKMQTKSEKDESHQVHLHLYAPKQKQLDDYEVIDV